MPRVRAGWQGGPIAYVAVFAVVASIAQFAGSATLALSAVIIASGCSAVIVAVRLVDLGEWWIAIPFSAGLAVTGTTQLLAHLFAHGPGVSLVLQLAVLAGHIAVGYGVLLWARMRTFSGRQPWLAVVVPAALVPIVWIAAAIGTRHGWAGLTDVRVASVLRVATDAAVLVVVLQASVVRARKDRAFILLRYAFSVQLAAAVILVVGVWNGFGIPTSFRTLTIVVMALMGAAALRADFGSRAPCVADAVDGGAFRLIETATVVLALVVATGFSGRDDDVFSFVRVLAVAVLVALILTRSDRALRDLEARASAARYRSQHDDLTGLPNRSALVEKVEAAAASDADAGGADTTLVLVRLDGLKTVVDCYGRSVSSEMVVDAADRIRRAIGAEGRVFRNGFDSFVVLFEGVAERAVPLAERAVATISRPFQSPGAGIVLTARAGIASLSGRRLLPDDLLREADTAAGFAEVGVGSPVAVFDDRLRAEAIRRLEVSGRLRDAVAAGAFEVHYQSIVDASTGTVTAYEALLRWRDDDVLRTPGAFMDIAEESGVIVDIGRWVIDSAVDTVARWWSVDGAHRVPVAINVSARQLRDSELSTLLAAALTRTGLPAQALWVEVTETALIADTDIAARALSELADLGVTICLDDFGVGYSALQHLSAFPISIVKIDKSFVAALRADRDGEAYTDRRRAIVRNLVTMAGEMGMSTVAEGVEDAELADRIKELGCTYAQGWYYSHPEPAHVVSVGRERGRPARLTGAAGESVSVRTHEFLAADACDTVGPGGA